MALACPNNRGPAVGRSFVLRRNLLPHQPQQIEPRTGAHADQNLHRQSTRMGGGPIVEKSCPLKLTRRVV
jgi:hypothetical protein